MLSEKPWKLDRVVVFLLAAAICLFTFALVAGAVAHYSGREKLDENSLVDLLLMTMSLHGSILLAAAVALYWFGVGWREAFGFAKGGAWRAVALGVIVGAVFLPVAWVLQTLSGELLGLFYKTLPVQEAVQTMEKADAWDCRIYFIVWSILIGPAAEEILFRGILYPAIKQLGFPRTALWGTAVLFAAIHGNLPIFVPLVALGLGLALLYEKTNNLLASITAHGFFNAANIVAFYLAQHQAIRQ